MKTLPLFIVKLDIYLVYKPKSKFIATIKECTSKTVFSDFKGWYLENASMFDLQDELNNNLHSVVGLSEAMCLPIISDYDKRYMRTKFDKVNNLTLDFYEGHFISQYYGYSIKGIFGNCYVSSDTVISFYDSNWKFICSKSLTEGFHDIGVWGAARMVIKGSGGYFNFDPDFAKMTMKKITPKP